MIAPSHAVAEFPKAIMALFSIALITACNSNAGNTSVVSEFEASAELIPRSVIFGNPEQTNPKISPDGHTLAWLAPVDGVMNIWVSPVEDPISRQFLTAYDDRDLSSFNWAPDSSGILFTRDVNGNENTQIYFVDRNNRSVRALTSAANDIRFTIESISLHVLDSILISSNERDRTAPDLYRLDLRTGQRQLLFENRNGYSRWVIDSNLSPLAGLRQIEGGGAEISRLDGQVISSIPDGDFLTTYPLSVSRDGNSAYFMDSRDANTAGLTKISLSDGSVETLFRSQRADTDDALIDPRTGTPVAVVSNFLRADWAALDDQVADDFAILKKQLRGDISITSTSADFSRWIIISDAAEAPGQYYFFDRANDKLTLLFSSRPELVNAPLQEQQALEILSRDDMTLVSYLTTPLGWDRTQEPVPMVLHVHGGPWGRDRYGYSSWHQWLSNRGYAVLSVNYRGSVGFGRDFVEASTHEFAGKMHDDLIDAVDWAIGEGIADKDRIAISGASYGGYAALVGLSFTPDRFACAVDIVGPSNLATLIDGFPEYWAPFLENTWYKYVGNPSKPAERQDMISRSPVSRVDAITKPLLIAQGQNDPRVRKRESDQIAEQLIRRGVDVSYINFADEGHGFVKSENRLAFYAVTERFLSGCLGGRYEPITNELQKSSVEFIHLGESLEGIAPSQRFGVDPSK